MKTRTLWLVSWFTLLAGCGQAEAGRSDERTGDRPAASQVGQQILMVAVPWPTRSISSPPTVPDAHQSAPVPCIANDLATCSSLCDQGNARACYSAMKIYDDWGVFDLEHPSLAEHREAFRSFGRKACERGDLDACERLGVVDSESAARQAAIDPLLGKKELVLAQSEFAKACEAGRAHACLRAAELLKWAAQPIDLAAKTALATKGETLYQAACDGGEMAACRELGEALFDGPPDRRGRAVALFDRACEGGDGVGCRDALRDSSLDGNNGRVLHSVRACQAGFGESCSLVGLYLSDAAVGPKQLQKAFAHFQRACSEASLKWDALGCTRAAEMLERGSDVPQDLPRALSLHERACRLGKAYSCTRLVEMHRKTGAFPDQDKALLIAHAMCAHRVSNFAGGCLLEARLHAAAGSQADLAEADKILVELCGAKESGLYCREAVALYENGTDLPKDAEKARVLASLGCKAGNANVCR